MTIKRRKIHGRKVYTKGIIMNNGSILVVGFDSIITDKQEAQKYIQQAQDDIWISKNEVYYKINASLIEYLSEYVFDEILVGYISEESDLCAVYEDLLEEQSEEFDGINLSIISEEYQAQWNKQTRVYIVDPYDSLEYNINDINDLGLLR